MPTASVIFISIRQSTMRSIFLCLRSLRLNARVVVGPSGARYRHCVAGDKYVVMEPLLGRSPLCGVKNCYIPALRGLLISTLISGRLRCLRKGRLCRVCGGTFSQCGVGAGQLLHCTSHQGHGSGTLDVLGGVRS